MIKTRAYDEIYAAVKKLIGSSRQYPFLFIGSGLSRRYLGSPDWAGLLRGLCTEALGDEFSYPRFVTEARAQLGMSTLDDSQVNLLPMVASLMETEVAREVLTSPRMGRFRDEHRDALLSGRSPLKLLVSDQLSRLSVDRTDEFEILAGAGAGKVSGVITTNYDHLCKELFPSFSFYVGERGMLFNEASYAQEVYQIHGSIDEPESLVLTSEDYRAFDEGKDYLAAKLLTIFLEFPVIFLGYSLQDRNIERILASVARCVGQARIDEMRDRLLFVRYGDEESSPVGSTTFNFDGQTVAMTCIETADFSPIYQAISDARKEFPLRLVRELKGNVYDLASVVDPSADVVTSGLDSIISNPDANKKVVIGVALFSGQIGKPMTPEDIFEDILLDDLGYDPKLIIEHYLNTFVRRNAGAIPVFKYASAVGWENLGKDVSDLVSKHGSVDAFKTKSIAKTRARVVRDVAEKTGSSVMSVGAVLSTYGERALGFLPVLNEDEIDEAELGSYLSSTLRFRLSGAREQGGILRDSNFRKLVQIYDFLHYGKGKPPDLHQ